MLEPAIVTRRLTLRPLQDDDALAVYGYRADPRVARFQGFTPASLREVEAFIARARGTPFDTPGTWYQLGVCLRESAALVGDVGMRFLAEDARQAEIGFTIAPPFQGQGYGTEAVRGVLGLLFTTLGKHRVFASVDPRNTASVALLEKVGMQREAHFRQSLWFKGEWVDDVVYGILAQEWAQRGGR